MADNIKALWPGKSAHQSDLPAGDLAQPVENSTSMSIVAMINQVTEVQRNRCAGGPIPSRTGSCIGVEPQALRFARLPSTA